MQKMCFVICRHIYILLEENDRHDDKGGQGKEEWGISTRRDIPPCSGTSDTTGILESESAVIVFRNDYSYYSDYMCFTPNDCNGWKNLKSDNTVYLHIQPRGFS
jgi:hypothetical protein